MKVAREFVKFDRATDALVMLRQFGREQDRFCGADERLIGVIVPRVFPNSDDALTIQYKLTIENRRARTQRELVLCGNLRLNSALESDTENRSEEHAFAWPELNLSVMLYPFDPKLKVLQVLCDHAQGTAFLHDLAPQFGWEGYDIHSYSYDVLSYRLERRAVLKIRVGLLDRSRGVERHETIVCRIVRPNKIERTTRIHKAVIMALNGELSAGERVVPEILAVDESSGAYFMELVTGASLCDLTESALYLSGCSAARRILDRMHQAALSELPEYTVTMEIEELRKKVSIVGSLFPEMASPAQELTARLTELAEELDFGQGTAVVHRDFYDKQVIVSAGRVALLDFDSLSIGDAAQDVGNFLGHCQLRQLQEPQHFKKIADGAYQFSSATDSEDQTLELRVTWWQAATLLRLGLIYALRPRWRGIAGNLLDASADHVRNLSSKLRTDYAKTK